MSMSALSSLVSKPPQAGTAAAGAPGAASKTDKSPSNPSALGPTSSAADQSDRFLKLLVAQMSNQDPLNPMDSAQVTSQMAQISTVEGVQTLNKTVSGLNGQFAQLQAMQGVALVGHDVAVEGNSARIDPQTHAADGGFELDGPATDVAVELLDPAGKTVGTLKLGAQEAGRHSFDFDVPEASQGQKLSFRVSAKNGADPVDVHALAYRGVTAVSTADGKLSLELDDGRRVGYDDVHAFL